MVEPLLFNQCFFSVQLPCHSGGISGIGRSGTCISHNPLDGEAFAATQFRKGLKKGMDELNQDNTFTTVDAMVLATNMVAKDGAKVLQVV